MAGVPDDERKAMVGGTLGDLLGFEPRWRPEPAERVPLRRARRGRHRRRARHRSGLRTPAGRARRQRRRQRPRRLDRGTAPTPGRRPRWWPRSSPPAGSAIADTSDIVHRDGAQALVDTAVERFGRIDVLVNNAGIIRWAGMPEVDEDNLARHLAVHVGGSFNTARAAWPHMVDQGYGRIVMTTSAGMFGLPNNTSYATAKGARRRAHPQPRGRRRRARHHGQRHRPRGDDAHGRARAATSPRPRCRPISSPRWSPSSPTRSARSAARSTPPAPAASPASSSP